MKGKWIAAERGQSSPIIFKTIETEKAESAQISVSGLGYYELYINGRRVGDEFYKPAFTDYCARDFRGWLYPLEDITSHRIYYNRYDIAKYLKKGKNVIALMLGNGFYRQTRRDIEGKVHFGERLLACYEISVTASGKTEYYRTDGTERCVNGFIVENNLFYGETHDYAAFDFTLLKRGACAKDGSPVQIAEPPCENVAEQTCPNDKIARTVLPELLYEKDGRRIYDAGENISGFVVLTSAGETVRVRHAENLRAEGGLDYSSAGGEEQISECKYMNAEKGRVVHPWFCWSGFRYFEVEGNAENVRVAVVHSDVPVTSSFRCGNETLQWLYNAYIRTQLNNMHGGVPSDCPHRERLGYTGDGQLTAETALLLLDSRAFYEKWMQDIADCQDVRSGHIQHTAPFCGGGGGPGGWGGAVALIPYYHYRTYRDKAFIAKYLPNIHRYLNCMSRFTENGLIVREREKGWCLGEWCTPEPVVLPEPYVNTFYYIVCMRIADYLARETGAAVRYTEQICESERALERNYYNATTHSYCGGVQGADAFALTLGLGDEQTKKNLICRYEKLCKFDTGIFGTEILASYLARCGRAELLLKLLTSEESFGYMKKCGATTLWEDWDGRSSHDHPMFGGCVKQIFFGLLGISHDEGYRKTVISPPYLPELKYIKAGLGIGGGRVWIYAKYQGGATELTVRTEGIKVTVKDLNGAITEAVENEQKVFTVRAK